jgi:hypothetical protein
LRAQFAHQFAVLVSNLVGAEQQQLVGTQVDGGAGGDVFAGQVEDLAGRRVAQRRQQHDGALVEQAVDAFAVDPAHFAGVVVIDPSSTPIGRAVTRLPDATRRREPCIGEAAMSIDRRASMARRRAPTASITQSRVAASVMRRPW